MEQLSARLAAAVADRYALIREIGAGGMAVVLLAEDRRHHRNVALKVLRPELAASIGAERFLREIETAAGLQHPHVVPVYDSGAVDGLLYYVMPFVEGESLYARIVRDGPMPIPEAVRIAREVASALAYAHARGLVHRDIKPENILLSGGHAVVADFGIARAVDAASGGRLTATGMAVGTPMYMSPEQALGSADVDARSDIYSLGCVLYEMLTGEQPFKGPSLQSVIAQSITAPRPRVRARRPEVPPAVDAAVVKALAKEPPDRFATVEDFAQAIAGAEAGRGAAGAARWRPRTIAVVAAAALAVLAVAAGGARWLASRRPSGAVADPAQVIAVLPFRTTGADVRLMGEGLVDLLSTNLDAVGGIRTVDPRTVLNRWRTRSGDGAPLALPQALAVGRDVAAGAVLLGSVVSLGSKVRISAELYAVDGTPLARAQVDGPTDSALALVDTLSVAVLRDVWRERRPVPELRASALTTGSVDALRAYLEGEQHFRRSEWQAAAAAFSTAIEKDSTFALAYLRLAWTVAWQEGAASTSPDRVLKAGLRYVGRLPARDRSIYNVMYGLWQDDDYWALDTVRALVVRYPDDIDAWALLGEIHFHGRGLMALTPDSVLMPFDRVLRLDPSLTSALIHPIELSLIRADRASFDRYVARLRAAAPEQAAPYLLAARAVWGPSDSAAAVLGELLQHHGSVAAVVIKAAYHSSSLTPDALLPALERSDRSPGSRTTRLEILSSIGRLDAARGALDTLLAQMPPSSRLGNAVSFAALTPVLAGYADASFARRALDGIGRLPSGDPFAAYARATYALSQGDVAAARATLGAALGSSTALTPLYRGLLRGARGWAALVAGDSAAGIQELEAGVRIVGFTGDPLVDALTAPLRYQRALATGRRPETRSEAIRYLQYGFDADIQLLPVAYRALGDALEAAGDRAGAAGARATLARLWTTADSVLRPATTATKPR